MLSFLGSAFFWANFSFCAVQVSFFGFACLFFFLCLFLFGHLASVFMFF